MARTSLLERSPIEHMSSPARRAAAARMSGSWFTGSDTSRCSIVALLAKVLSSCVRSGVCSMFGEDFVKGRDRCIHMLLLQNVRRQETQNRVAGAVDQNAPFEHFRHDELTQVRGVHFRGQHQPLAAYVHDAFVLLGEGAQPLLEIVANLGGMRQKPFAL